MSHKVVIVGDRGRMVLPSAVRRELGITAGAPMLLGVEPDGSLRLRPFRAAAEQTQGLLRKSAPYDGSAVDDLLAERRAEAAREE
jgi:AbrB family looped-hinge helix DNA binding protein